jgi:hypothetical protein
MQPLRRAWQKQPTTKTLQRRCNNVAGLRHPDACPSDWMDCVIGRLGAALRKTAAAPRPGPRPGSRRAACPRAASA